MGRKRCSGTYENPLELDKHLTWTCLGGSSSVATTSLTLVNDSDNVSTFLHALTVLNNGAVLTNFSIKLDTGSLPVAYIPADRCIDMESRHDVSPVWDTAEWLGGQRRIYPAYENSHDNVFPLKEKSIMHEKLSKKDRKRARKEQEKKQEKEKRKNLDEKKGIQTNRLKVDELDQKIAKELEQLKVKELEQQKVKKLDQQEVKELDKQTAMELRKRKLKELYWQPAANNLTSPNRDHVTETETLIGMFEIANTHLQYCMSC